LNSKIKKLDKERKENEEKGMKMEKQKENEFYLLAKLFNKFYFLLVPFLLKFMIFQNVQKFLKINFSLF
jgi:hypothetical protein